MSADREVDNLDWSTASWILDLIKDRRLRHVEEYENEYTEDWRKDQLLYLRMELTDLRAEIMERFLATTDKARSKKDS